MSTPAITCRLPGPSKPVGRPDGPHKPPAGRPPRRTLHLRDPGRLELHGGGAVPTERAPPPHDQAKDRKHRGGERRGESNDSLRPHSGLGPAAKRPPCPDKA